MKRALLLSACLLAAGCIRSDIRRMDLAERPIRSPDSVTVLAEEPDQPYTVIATLKCSGETIFDSFDDIRRRMIADAAMIGGDALIMGPESTESTFLILTPALVKSDRKELSAEVIVFDRPSQRGA